MQKPLQSILLAYLRILAAFQIKKFKFLSRLQNKKFLVVALTGSAGKTSTIQAIEAALKDDYKVKTNNNYNSEYGLPANILGQKLEGYSPASWVKASIFGLLNLLTNWSYPEIYLIEMDVDGPDEPLNIKYLLKIVRPNIAIHLNVNNVHTQNFDPLIPKRLTGPARADYARQLMCNEQSVLTQSLSKNQTAILNSNDKLVWETRKNISAKILKIKNFELKMKKYALPDIYKVTFGTAITLAAHLGIPHKKAVASLNKYFTLPPSRATLFKGIHGTTLIDSTYNASPQPMREYLSLLKSHKGHRIAILGDMRELGLQSEHEHRLLGSMAQKSANLIITIGPETKKYFPDSPKIHKFLYYWDAISFIKKQNLKNSFILLKGSQNTIFTEEVLVSLLQKKSDRTLVCRQTPHWLTIKKDFYEKHK